MACSHLLGYVKIIISRYIVPVFLILWTNEMLLTYVLHFYIESIFYYSLKREIDYVKSKSILCKRLSYLGM